jgi:hypothetical protein
VARVSRSWHAGIVRQVACVAVVDCANRAERSLRSGIGFETRPCLTHTYGDRHASSPTTGDPGVLGVRADGGCGRRCRGQHGERDCKPRTSQYYGPAGITISHEMASHEAAPLVRAQLRRDVDDLERVADPRGRQGGNVTSGAKHHPARPDLTLFMLALRSFNRPEDPTGRCGRRNSAGKGFVQRRPRACTTFKT